MEDLPDELQVAVLSFLPWNEVMRLRTVCLKGNELLRSSELRRKWHGGDPNQPPLCFIGYKDFGLSVYNPVGHSWQLIGSNYPPSFFTFPDESGSPYRTPNVRMMGAAHGLLLLQVFLHVNLAVPVKIELFVMNPLDPSTKKRIPLLAQLQNHFTIKALGIAWNERTQSHQILLQYRPDPVLDPYSADRGEVEETEMWTFYKYDLLRDEWNQVARWPGDRVREFQHPSIKKGRFYCLAKESLSIMPCIFCLYGLDSSDRNWMGEPTWIEEDDNHSIPHQFQFATLVHDDQGSLLASGQVQSKFIDFGRHSILKKFSVWKARTDKLAHNFLSSLEDPKEDVDVYELPEATVQKLNDGISPKQFQCTATAKFVCVANSMGYVALFDISNNLWWTLPTHPVNYSTDLPGQGNVLNWLGMNKLDLHLCEPMLDILL